MRTISQAFSREISPRFGGELSRGLWSELSAILAAGGWEGGWIADILLQLNSGDRLLTFSYNLPYDRSRDQRLHDILKLFFGPPEGLRTQFDSPFHMFYWIMFNIASPDTFEERKKGLLSSALFFEWGGLGQEGVMLRTIIPCDKLSPAYLGQVEDGVEAIPEAIWRNMARGMTYLHLVVKNDGTADFSEPNLRYLACDVAPWMAAAGAELFVDSIHPAAIETLGFKGHEVEPG